MITLKTLHSATAQEVFDQVVKHLRTQGKKSGLSENSCLYRYGDLKCAAGCLIGDDEYRDSLEGKSWSGLVNEGLAPNYHEILISYLQAIHDSYDVEYWEKMFSLLASDHGLLYTKP